MSLALSIFMIWSGVKDKNIATQIYNNLEDTGFFEAVAEGLSPLLEAELERGRDEGFVEGVEAVAESIWNLEQVETGCPLYDKGVEDVLIGLDSFMFDSVFTEHKVCCE